MFIPKGLGARVLHPAHGAVAGFDDEAIYRA
jgi:hypothetical protein